MGHWWGIHVRQMKMTSDIHVLFENINIIFFIHNSLCAAYVRTIRILSRLSEYIQSYTLSIGGYGNS
jgi:hypothetical protein